MKQQQTVCLSSIVLRPYQQDCIGQIIKSIKENKKRIVVKAPCSFGKTIVFCEIARRCTEKKTKTLIILDNVALVSQTHKQLLKFINEEYLGIYCASLGSSDDTRLITVGTIQSLKNSKTNFNLIIIDECHDGISRLEKFCFNFNSVVIGFTATPYDAKGRPIYGVGKFFECLAYKMEVSKMIQMKMITPMVYKGERVDTKIDLSEVKLVGGDYKDSDLIKAYDMQTDKILKQIEDMGLRIAGRRKIIIICTGIKHAEFVASNLKGAITYHSEIDLTERKKILEQFEKGPYRFLIGVMAIYKGLDIPCVDCLVNMRPTRSKSFFVQFAGRGVRNYEGKMNCLFLDYGQTVEQLGFYEQIEEKEIRKFGNSQSPVTFPKKCPGCSLFVSPQTRTCECGHQFPFDRLSNLTESAFDGSSISKPSRIVSEIVAVEEVVFGRHLKVVIKDPNQIPPHAKGSKYTVNFYNAGQQQWQEWKYRKIKSKLKEGKFLVWELSPKGWPEFIACEENANGHYQVPGREDTGVKYQN